MKLTVSTSAELESAFVNPSVKEIQLLNNITLSQNLTLHHDIVIHGGGKTMEMGAFKLDAKAHNLTLADRLHIQANDSKTGSTMTGTGKFIVEEGANIHIHRALGACKTHLMDGFSDYRFKENSRFHAQAGTNRSESNKGTAQTGVIRSFSAKSFVVENNASVTLLADHSSTQTADHGSSALILRKPKGGELHIEVHENATLNIIAYGTGLTTRNRAPVLILHEPVPGNTGVSKTRIQGKLNVTSNNGNGWYYQYIDYVTDTADFFTVDGGEVHILAQNGGSKDKTEYAAFESYGRNPTSITVENGGVMHVIGNGYRGMSLAGGGSYAKKSIVVKGAGSKLKVYGYMWAIAAETQPTLSISALDGGEIVLESCVDNLGEVAFAGSTVYSVGPTTYHVDGPGSKMDILHRGGEYGAIFADGYGELKINVTGGGNMYVYNKNSGSNKAARRAAICAQSGLSNLHSILIDGDGSVLRVFNDNPEKTNDTSLYPRSAIAFAANTSGNIIVRKGGSLFARNNDADSPAIALGGYGTDNTLGKLTVDSPREIDIRNDAAGTSPYAVALRSTNYLQNKQGNTKPSLEVKDTNLTTWPIGHGTHHWPDANSLDKWYVDSTPFVAPNNAAVPTPFPGNKGNTSFQLSGYGKIAMEGTVTSVTINEGDLRILINATGQLSVTVLPEWAKNREVAWTSSDPSIATVNADGVVTPRDFGVTRRPHNLGFTTMTATSTDGSNKSDSCEVEVYTIPVERIELIPDFPTSGLREGIEFGKEASLRARICPADAVEKRLVWSSSDPSVLSITQSGDEQAAEQTVVLKALQRSDDRPIRITATAWDNYGATAFCEVRVYIIPVSSIRLNKTSLRMCADQRQQLVATVEPADATLQTLHWSSNDPSTASVDSTGLVTAHNTGAAKMTASATDGSGVQVECPVTVTQTTYTVLIKTSNRDGAGTDADIDLVLEGTGGRKSESIRLNPLIWGDAFRQNRLDVVALPMPDIGVIQEITLTLNRFGFRPAWHIEYVRIIRNGNDISEFQINRELASGPLTSAQTSPTTRLSDEEPHVYKPIYIIDHKCNNTDEIDEAILRGANAVECDVRYRNGIFYADHDHVWNTRLDDWLNAAEIVADKYGGAFALVYFDIKDGGNNAREHLRDLMAMVQEHGIATKLNFIYSIAKVSDAAQFRSCYSDLNPNEGFNIDQEDEPDDVIHFYSGFNPKIERCWYGNGYYAGGHFPDSVKNSLEKANNKHRGVADGNGKVQKTVSWTYEDRDSVELLLDRSGLYKIDAILVNCTERVNVFVNVMRGVLEGFYGLKELRLATFWDDPFEFNADWYKDA